MTKWKPADVIALVLIIGGLGLKFSGMDGTVGVMLVVITAAYYGIDLTPYLKIGRVQLKKSNGKPVKPEEE